MTSNYFASFKKGVCTNLDALTCYLTGFSNRFAFRNIAVSYDRNEEIEDKTVCFFDLQKKERSRTLGSNAFYGFSVGTDDDIVGLPFIWDFMGVSPSCGLAVHTIFVRDFNGIRWTGFSYSTKLP